MAVYKAIKQAWESITKTGGGGGNGGGGGFRGSGSGQVKRLDTAYFDQAIAALKSANQKFATARNSIINQTKELMNDWSGDGYAQFKEIFWRLKRELDDEEELLTAMKNDLQGILETYQKWDQSMASSIAGDDVK